MGIGVGLSASVSLLTMSSPQAIWMMVNQFQLLMLLPLTSAFIPAEVIAYITGMNFVNFNFDFLPTNKAPGVEGVFEMLSVPQNDEYLQDIGLEYENSILNHASMFFVLLLYCSLHILLVGVYL